MRHERVDTIQAQTDRHMGDPLFDSLVHKRIGLGPYSTLSRA